MKIFIDSALISEIKEGFSYGVVDGVTTNPSLIKKAAETIGNISMKDYINEIFKVANGTPVSIEVTETSYEGMVTQAKKIQKMFGKPGNNVVIKIPVNTAIDATPNSDALQTIKEIKKLGMKINCTLIFTPEQALLAAKAGADYVSPFAGRVDDMLRTKAGMKFGKEDYYPAGGMSDMEDNGIKSGVDLVLQIRKILDNYGLKSEIIASSIRNARQARECALAGADIATIPLYAIKQMLIHDKTQEGMRSFIKDIVPNYKKMIDEG